MATALTHGLPAGPVAALWLALGMAAAIVLLGLLIWHMGESGGLPLAFWALAYGLWLAIPHGLPAELRHIEALLTLFGLIWLIGAWTRHLYWDDPKLTVLHLMIIAQILALAGILAFGVIWPLLARAP